MSGEKKSKTDKAEELWYRLNLDQKFKQDLEDLRAYAKKYDPNDLSGYYFRREFILEKYRILSSPRLRNLIDQEVLGLEIKETEDHFSFRLQTPSEIESHTNYRAFIKLWIRDGVTRDEVINYIKKNWKIIQKLIKLQDKPRVKRVRKVEKKDLVAIVLKLNRIPTMELRKMTNTPRGEKTYREIMISNLVNDRGFSTTFESVKGILSRYGTRKKA